MNEQSPTSSSSSELRSKGSVKGPAPNYAQSMTWLGFLIYSAVTKPVVHFFPSAGNVTAPYAATCKLTLFGGGIDRRGVNLEGARLSHPDGVRIDEVFTALTENANSLYGIEVEVGTAQQRVDLSGSSCMLEFVSGGQSVKFTPAVLTSAPSPLGRPHPPAPPRAPALVIRDGFHTTSFVLVNADKDSWSPDLALETYIGERFDRVAIPAPVVAPGHIAEVAIPEALFDQLPSSECAWGLVRSAPLSVGARPPQSGMFIIYRDAATRRPVSIRSV